MLATLELGLLPPTLLGGCMLPPLLQDFEGLNTLLEGQSLPATQQKGDFLPKRITNGRPSFAFTDLDCFRPFTVTHMRRTVKRYCCIFTCLAIRAVHLEILRSLDTDFLLNAFAKFMAHRGQLKREFSDNGTNFVRAAVRCWKSDHTITSSLQPRGI